MATPGRPISAICRHVASLNPRGSSIAARTARGVLSRLRNSRVRLRSITCSWVKSKSIALTSGARRCGAVGARLAREPQDTLADDVLLDLAVVQLVDRRLGAWPLALLELAEDAQAGVPEHLDLDDHAAESLPQERVLQRRQPVASQHARHVHQPAQVGLMAGDPRQDAAAALVAERRLRQLPALALLADDVLGRHADIGEEDFGELRAAGDLLQRAHLDARAVHVQDEVGDALVLGDAGVRPRQEHAEVGVGPEARPDLLPVDHPLVALAYGAGLEAGQVGAGIGFRVQLAPDVVGGEHAPQVALLLLLGAVHDQGRADQPQGEAVDGARHVGQGHLLGHDGLLHGPRLEPAVRARPAHADEAGLVQRPLPGFLLLEGLERPGPMLGEPAPRAVAKALVFG